MVGFGKYLLSGKFGMEYISYSEGGRYYESSKEEILKFGSVQNECLICDFLKKCFMTSVCKADTLDNDMDHEHTRAQLQSSAVLCRRERNNWRYNSFRKQ